MWFLFDLGDGAARDNMVRKYSFLIWSLTEHLNKLRHQLFSVLLYGLTHSPLPHQTLLTYMNKPIES